MKIAEALRLKDETLYIVNGRRWLYWDDQEKEWCVREKLPKSNRIVIRTASEDSAIDCLLFGRVVGKEE